MQSQAQQKTPQEFPQVLSQLQAFGFRVKLSFLQESFPEETRCSFRDAYEELLHADFRKSEHLEAVFGPTVNTAERDELMGPVVLQVISVLNVSQPSKRQHEDSHPRLLIVKLNDGHTSAGAVEYERIPDMSPKVAPGTKILLKNSVKICHGKLFLNSKHCQVLGGRVDHLYNAWLTNRTTLSHRKNKKHEGGEADSPPAFELKIASNRVSSSSSSSAVVRKNSDKKIAAKESGDTRDGGKKSQSNASAIKQKKPAESLDEKLPPPPSKVQNSHVVSKKEKVDALTKNATSNQKSKTNGKKNKANDKNLAPSNTVSDLKVENAKVNTGANYPPPIPQPPNTSHTQANPAKKQSNSSVKRGNETKKNASSNSSAPSSSSKSKPKNVSSNENPSRKRNNDKSHQGHNPDTKMSAPNPGSREGPKKSTTSQSIHSATGKVKKNAPSRSNQSTNQQKQRQAHSSQHQPSSATSMMIHLSLGPSSSLTSNAPVFVPASAPQPTGPKPSASKPRANSGKTKTSKNYTFT